MNTLLKAEDWFAQFNKEFCSYIEQMYILEEAGMLIFNHKK